MERNPNDKHQIRREMLAKRTMLPNEIILHLSKQCMDHIITLKEFQQADAVFLYVDANGEVRTRELIQYCFLHNKIIAIPKVEGKRVMNFYVIHSLDELSSGYGGILEPCTEQLLFPTENSCMICPGTAFDVKGNRIGYGGGYYDAYCQQYPNAYRVGICYDWQLFSEIPVSLGDVAMNVVITNKGKVLL